MSFLSLPNPQLADALATLRTLGAGFEPESSWAQVHLVEPTAIPLPQRQLLVHDRHMTAMLNRHYGRPVSLRVLEVRNGEETYRRKILLTTNEGADVVEYGLVRLHLSQLPAPAQQDVLSERTPLGEIFARYDLMTCVEVGWFLRFPAGSPIVDYFGHNVRSEAFGRLGKIHCNGGPAVELLEVVPG